MNSLARRIELIANLSIIVTAMLLSIVLVKSYLFTYSTTPNSNPNPSPFIADNQLQKGMKISLPDINWQKNGGTLLLTLSVTCHLCAESAPFYQRIVKEHSQTQLIALVPQTADEGQLYLKNLGVEVDDVKQVSPSTIGVYGTPTLILVDKYGTIINFWIGVLSEESEKELLTQLASERSSK